MDVGRVVDKNVNAPLFAVDPVKQGRHLRVISMVAHDGNALAACRSHRSRRFSNRAGQNTAIPAPRLPASLFGQ